MCVDMYFDFGCDGHYLINLSISEASNGFIEELNAVIDELFGCRGVERIPLAVEPLLLVLVPLIGCDPHVRVRLEFLFHAHDLIVIRGFHFEETFTTVELARVVEELLRLLNNILRSKRDLFVLIDVVVLVKVENRAFQVVDLILEIALRDFHFFQELHLLLLQFLCSKRKRCYD